MNVASFVGPIYKIHYVPCDGLKGDTLGTVHTSLAHVAGHDSFLKIRNLCCMEITLGDLLGFPLFLPLLLLLGLRFILVGFIAG